MAKKKNKNNGDSGGGGGGGGNNEGGEKKKEVQQEEQKGGGEKKQKGGGDKANPVTVVLKVDMHCEGCVSKIVKMARGLPGVEGVKAELGANKLTVVGMVDPSEVRDSLHAKIKKKVDLVSPQPKKEDSNQEKDGQKKQQKQQQPSDKKQEPEKKPKEAAVTTAVLKVEFHCQGCVEKIRKTVDKTKGVQEMTMDRQKETVTVKGTMDAKALAEAIKERLKRPVEIVPPKKEKEAKDKDDSGSGKKKGGGGGGGGGGQGQEGGGDDGAKLEGSKMEFMGPVAYGPGYGYLGQPIYGNGYMGPPVFAANGYMGQPVYGYGQEYGYGYGNGYGHGLGHHQVPGYPVHMKFNDENPNACSIM